MVFHGTKDTLVPYEIAAHHFCDVNTTGWLMFFGSHSIYNRIAELEGTCSLTSYVDKGHEKAGYLFYHNPEPILEFCNEILQGEKFMKHKIVK